MVNDAIANTDVQSTDSLGQLRLSKSFVTRRDSIGQFAEVRVKYGAIRAISFATDSVNFDSLFTCLSISHGYGKYSKQGCLTDFLLEGFHLGNHIFEAEVLF